MAKFPELARSNVNARDNFNIGRCVVLYINNYIVIYYQSIYRFGKTSILFKK